MSITILHISFKQVLPNCYQTVTFKCYLFLSYITGSIEEVTVVTLKISHVGEKRPRIDSTGSWNMETPYMTLMRGVLVLPFSFSLRNSEEIGNNYGNTHFWYIANSTYGIAKKKVTLKKCYFLAKRLHLSQNRRCF